MPIIYGGFTGGTFAQYYSFYIDYTVVSQSIDNNTSVITVNTYARKDKATQTAYGNNKSASQSVDGTGRGTTFSYDFRNGVSLKLVQSETYTVYHNADGTKSLYIGASANFGTSLLGAASAGATVSLPTIPRASTPTAAGSVLAGSTLRVTVAAASSSFWHRIIVSINDRSTYYDLGAGYYTADVAIPIDWLTTMTNTVSSALLVTLNTYTSGGALIGTKSTTSTMIAPSDVVPTVTGNITPVNQLGGYYVQSKSGVKVELIGAGTYGSTIVSIGGTVNNAVYTTKDFTHTFQQSGIANITGGCTDSRGRVASWVDRTIDVQPYNAPRIENLIVTRCNADGADNEQGEYIKVYVKASTTEVGSSNVNSHEFWFTYMPNGSTATRVNLPSTESSIDYTSAPVRVGQESTIEVFAYAKDAYSTVHQYSQVPTVFALIDLRHTGKGIAFGKSSERDAFEVNMEAIFNVPIGVDSGGTGTNTTDGQLAMRNLGIADFLPLVYYGSSGYLIETDIAADTNTMVSLQLSGNAYGFQCGYFIAAQFYNYTAGNSIINTGVTSIDNSIRPTLSFFNYQGVVCIYVPYMAGFLTHYIYVRTQNGDRVEASRNHAINYREMGAVPTPNQRLVTKTARAPSSMVG